MTASISIQQYIETKGGSLEEFYQYAQSKGLALPQDPTYVLPFEELGILDPIYAEQLNNNSNINKANSEEQKHQLAQEEQKDANQSNRLIGIVKFFDSAKGFGFIITNNAGINANETRLVDFYVNSRDCKNYTPNDGDWVTFKSKKSKAVNVRKLKYDTSTLFFAMKYRGKFAKIKGQDGYSGKTYDHSILSQIVNHYDNNKSAEIIEVFCDLLSTFSGDDVDSVIMHFIEDKDLVYSLLIRLYHSVDYFQDNKNKLLFVKLKKSVSDAIFDNMDIETLYVLPHNFDFSFYNSKICNILIKEAEKRPKETTYWLKKQSLSIVDFSELDDQNVNTIPLRLILSAISNSNSYISGIRVDWQTVCSYLKGRSSQIVCDFCKYYFENKDNVFISAHPIYDVIDNETKIQIIKQLILFNKSHWDAFVNRLFGSITKKVELLEQLPLSFVSVKLTRQELIEIAKYKIQRDYSNFLSRLKRLSVYPIFDTL